MNWQEACEDPNLQDLPFKIELNQDGDIIMSPVRVNHSWYQREIMLLLDQALSDGKALPEFPVETSDNVKSPDVVWISNERFAKALNMLASPVSPEICVEVKSPGNSMKKLLTKAELYFEKGALEVWICDEDGQMQFFSSAQQLEHSKLVPTCPLTISKGDFA